MDNTFYTQTDRSVSWSSWGSVHCKGVISMIELVLMLGGLIVFLIVAPFATLCLVEKIINHLEKGFNDKKTK